MREDRGVTMAELLVTMFAGMIVLSAILFLVQISTQHQAWIATRVATNQRARPVMTHIVDSLHSACVAPGIAPVFAGSGGSSLTLVSKSGSSVSPTPDKRVLGLTGSTLSESIYPATGGAPPSWTFASTPTSVREVLTHVGAGSIGDPPASVPFFQYFAYNGGQLSTTPLATPLSPVDAARTVKVTVSFATSPTSNPVRDPGAPVTLSDSAILRLEPASEDTSEVNLPCV